MQTLLWSKPFSKLKRSYDDGTAELYLEFGKHGTEVIESQVCTSMGYAESVAPMVCVNCVRWFNCPNRTVPCQ